MHGPEWRAIGRESSLACNLIGNGITNLGRADYTNLGNYYTAFFGLSIGLERMAKLALVADYTIEKGTMPDQAHLRRYSHDISKLLKECETLVKKHALALTYQYPCNPISNKIIGCLDSFAAASKGRYANFGELSNPTFNNEEPVLKWWKEVAEFILKEKFYGTPREKAAERFARLSEKAMSPALVSLSTEEGRQMSDIYSAAYRGAQAKTVQQYGRFYTLVIVRWLAEVLSAVADIAAHQHNIAGFLGLREHYDGNYIVPDTFLKQRKTWPILKNY